MRLSKCHNLLESYVLRLSNCVILPATNLRELILRLAPVIIVVVYIHL